MVLGVTGGVGSGKSAVLDYMEKEYGALVIKADDIARALSETEGPALYAIRELFAEEGVLTPEGLMDRAKVSKVIFCDDEKRRALETILHSGTEGEIKTRINNSRKHDPHRLILVESAIFSNPAATASATRSCTFMRTKRPGSGGFLQAAAIQGRNLIQF